MTTKHTPGPWHVGGLQGTGRAAIVYSPDGYSICDCKSYHGKREWSEMEANARLIAAAPDLLAALEYWFDSNADSKKLAGMARAAIAKAKGE